MSIGLIEFALKVQAAGGASSCWLLMSASTAEQVRTKLGTEVSALEDMQVQLAGIPIMLDNAIPDGGWRLLDRKGRQVASYLPDTGGTVSAG